MSKLIYWPESQVCMGCSNASLVDNIEPDQTYVCTKATSEDDDYPAGEIGENLRRACFEQEEE